MPLGVWYVAFFALAVGVLVGFKIVSWELQRLYKRIQRLEFEVLPEEYLDGEDQ